MKKLLLITSLLAATATQSAVADTDARTWRQAGVFFGSAIAGAAVAGPIGMAAAAVSGIWLEEQVDKAADLDDVSEALTDANQQIDELRGDLSVALRDSQQYAELALQQLQLELLFKTGQSELTDYGKERLALLADFMRASSDLSIRLDGYADPRGDATYNLNLSSERVLSVAEQLENHGVAKQRISVYSHGASQSVASEGDIDAYALERVVRIQLTNGHGGAGYDYSLSAYVYRCIIQP